MAAVRAGFADFAVATGNAGEAELVPGARVVGYGSLARVALDFGADPQALVLDEYPDPGRVPAAAAVPSGAQGGGLDLGDVAGQQEARQALEVAAAGGHHLLMVGPPGAGKTMLAERLPGLLPDLDDAEAMEVTAIHSLDGGAASVSALIRRPPYERPHHTASTVSIIGGGSGLPRPGAASRAHKGVLFLDEAPEYERKVLDALRQPLESGELVLHRSAGTASYPARFQLVLAANPCPCGKAAGKGMECTCSAMDRRRYFGRLSGPLLDRVDIQLQVHRLSLAELSATGQRDSTAVVAERSGWPVNVSAGDWLTTAWCAMRRSAESSCGASSGFLPGTGDAGQGDGIEHPHGAWLRPGAAALLDLGGPGRRRPAWVHRGGHGFDHEAAGDGLVTAGSEDVDVAVRLARAALTRVMEPSDLVGLALIRAAGPVDALRVVRGEVTAGAEIERRVAAQLDEADALSGWQGLAPAILRWAPRLPDLAPQRDLEVIRRLGGGLLIPEDPDWPEALADLGLGEPIALWVRGTHRQLPPLQQCVAVVGSRDSTGYGASVTADMAHGLAQRSLTVVSGGAYGIDAHAHSAALAGARSGIPTIAVMAGGVDRFYPMGNEELLRTVAREGAMIAEVPPGSNPTRYRFLQRNRLIAALCAVTVVVEARWRSGALSTAHHADLLAATWQRSPDPCIRQTLPAVTACSVRGPRSALPTPQRWRNWPGPAGRILPPKSQVPGPTTTA